MRKICYVLGVLFLLISCSENKEKQVEEIREELKEILKLDQEPRNRIVELWQTAPQDTLLQRQIGMEIWRNDSINLIRVREILDNYELEFGEENEVLWVVIQHSSLELQQKYLPKFIKAAEEGKIKGELIAMMQDRICCTLGKPQVYGTQGNYDDNGVFVPVAIEDSVNVDVRRAALGMMPLSDYIKDMSRK